MSDPVFQALPFEVTVMRWFHSKEIWTYIAGLVLNIGPIVLQGLGTLGLPPSTLLIYLMIVNALVYSAGIYNKNQSSAVIGSKDDVAAATAPPADEVQ
jgi:hypothetical protein